MQEYGGESLNSVFGLLKENEFDIRKTLSSLSPEKIAPIMKSVFEKGNNDIKEGSPFHSEPEGLSPINNIADYNITQTLNRYFG